MIDLTGALLGGRYRVGRKLGEGGMGAVYEGLQEDLARSVALKILHPHLAADEELRGRFRREARVVARLGHPNVVQISDFQVNEGEPPFFVMELLHGESLRDLMRRSVCLEPSRVAYIAVQVLSALEAAHGANVVHRDVKPDNIFLERTSVQADLVKVLDFGVAKLLGDETSGTKLTRAGLVVGTLAYMPPEQAHGDPVDGRADLYSLAAVMYLAIAGKKPFDGATTALLLDAILHRAPVPLAKIRPDVDEGLSAIVDRALAKRPGDRFASAAEMARALAPFARSTTLGSARSPTPLDEPTSALPSTPVMTVRTPTSVPGMELDGPRTAAMPPAPAFEPNRTMPIPRRPSSHPPVAPPIPMAFSPERSRAPWIVSIAVVVLVVLVVLAASAVVLATLHPWRGLMGSN